jgi:hypothetical protein
VTASFLRRLSLDAFGISGDMLGAASVDDPEDHRARRNEE